MSIISSSKANTKTSDREPSVHDGMWINVGVVVVNPETNEESFIRLSRGIAISDLQPKKIYPNMSAEFASQIAVENQMLAEIQAAALNLEEGESISSDVLVVQLYRRNEETEGNTAPVGSEGALNLFS